MVEVTAIYASILGLAFMAMGLWVVKTRVRRKVAAGDKGDPEMANAMRAHANFAEHVPILVILMGLAEVNGLAPLWLHAAGLALLIARGMHFAGMRRLPHWSTGRGGGATLTFVLLLALSLVNLWLVIL